MSLQGFSSDKTPTTCKKVTIGLQLATGTPVEGGTHSDLQYPRWHRRSCKCKQIKYKMDIRRISATNSPWMFKSSRGSNKVVKHWNTINHSSPSRVAACKCNMPLLSNMSNNQNWKKLQLRPYPSQFQHQISSLEHHFPQLQMYQCKPPP